MKKILSLLVLTVFLLVTITLGAFAESPTAEISIIWLPDWLELAPFHYNKELGWAAFKGGKDHLPLVMDVATGAKIDEYQDVANAFFDGLAWVADWQLKGGYINRWGKVIISPQYDSVSDFSGGVAIVGKHVDNGPLKYGAINTTGAVVVPFEYDKIHSFSEGMARVEKEGRFGFVDEAGKLLYLDGYDNIKDFSEGLATIRKIETGKYGFIDNVGATAIPMQYDETGSFSNGLAPVKKDGKYGFIDKNGEMVIPANYDFIGSFIEGLAIVKSGEKYGFVDTTGKEVVSPTYDRAENFSEGFALVRREDLFYGFINIAGEEVISLNGVTAHSFSNGFAKIETRVGTEGTRYGLLDKTGAIVLPIEYDWIDCEGLGSSIVIVKDSHFGIIETTFKMQVPDFPMAGEQYDKVSVEKELPSIEGLAQSNSLNIFAVGILVVGLVMLGMVIKMKWHSSVLIICILLLICDIGLLAVATIPSSTQTPSVTSVPTPSPIQEPTPTPEPIPPDITLGYWETNSFRLSDGLIYQFKDDGTYESWHLNGAFAPSGHYTYEDWILTILDNAGQKADQLYYALETGEFVSTMTEHVVDQQHMDNNGILIPARFEPTTLAYHNTPTAPNPGPMPEIIPSTIAIDLSDPEIYRAINIFLSNFSECAFSSFSVEAPDYGGIADFAFLHAWINSPSVIEDYSKYFPVHDDYDLATTCVSVSYIEKVAQRFFAGEANVSEIESAWKNGHGQGIITNGMYGLGFTLVDSVTDLGKNQFEAQFHIYTVPYTDYPTYDASSSSDIYSARPENLPQPLFTPNQSFIGTPGSATFETVQNEDGSLSFYLLTYARSENY